MGTRAPAHRLTPAVVTILGVPVNPPRLPTNQAWDRHGPRMEMVPRRGWLSGPASACRRPPSTRGGGAQAGPGAESLVVRRAKGPPQSQRQICEGLGQVHRLESRDVATLSPSGRAAARPGGRALRTGLPGIRGHRRRALLPQNNRHSQYEALPPTTSTDASWLGHPGERLICLSA